MLTLRRTRLQSASGKTPADDYEVLDEDHTVIGRIYFTREVAHGPRWFWSNLRQPNRPSDRGRADNLESAKVAFKKSWEE